MRRSFQWSLILSVLLALTHRRQDDSVASAAELRGQRGDDGLQAAVAAGWNRQPRAGVHEDLHADQPGTPAARRAT